MDINEHERQIFKYQVYKQSQTTQSLITTKTRFLWTTLFITLHDHTCWYILMIVILSHLDSW